MTLKLSALVMLGLACASCAGTGSSLTHLARIGSGPGAIDVNRRSDGGLMVSGIYFNGSPHPDKAILVRRFNQAARNVGCMNGSVPTYDDRLEINGERFYSLAAFYKCH